MQGSATLYYGGEHVSKARYFNQSGEPIWGLRDDAEAALLRKLCAAHDIDLKTGVPKAGDAGEQLCGEVVVFQPELIEAASQYAHLTGRRETLVSGVGGIPETTTCQVVIATTDAVTLDLLETLLRIGKAQRCMPGIIAGPLDQIRPILLAKAFFATYVAKRSYASVELYTNLAMDTAILDGNRHIFGRDAEAAKIKAHLGGGRNLFVFMGHSDGVDATLSDRAYICTIRQATENKDQPGKPQCHTEGHCKRLNLPVREAVNSPRILDAEDVRARVALWSTCWGFSPPANVDGAFGLGAKLSHSTQIGALITPVGNQLQSHALLHGLITALSVGTPVGDAVYQHNESSLARQVGHTLFVLGDPLCIAGTMLDHDIDRRAERTTPLIGEVRRVNSRIFFLECIAATFKTQHPPGQGIKMLHDYAARFGSSPPAEGRSDELAELQHWFLEAACTTNPWMDWTAKLGMWIAGSAGQVPCSTCGNRALVTLFTGYMHHPFLRPRTVIRCPRCSISSDVPADSRVKVAFSEQGLSLSGERHPQGCRAMIAVETVSKVRRLQPWPLDSGVLMRHFNPSMLWDHDVKDCFAMILDGLDVSVFHGYPSEVRLRRLRARAGAA